MNGWCRSFLGLLVLLLASPAVSYADDFSPALLQITERQGGWVDVLWKKPVKRNSKVVAITPVLPDFMQVVGSPVVRETGLAWIENSTYRTGGKPLTAATLSIDGLDVVPNDVLVRITLQDGSQYSTILRSGNTSYTIPEQATKLQVAGDYWLMGTIHILEGADHLLFVFALLLIVNGLMPLIKAVTSFTVAHSITLALATLGMVNMPSSPTEAIIALSIVFLAAEIIHKRQGKLGVTERWPWLIAFIFGLFHGLGFAGALSEIGLPQHEIPLALLMFNVGVETGQLLFIAAVLSLIALLKRLPLHLPQGSWRLVPYSIGGIAAFWTIDRVMSFIPAIA
jgi:hydrogenase/urease accessory protein HupE